MSASDNESQGTVESDTKEVLNLILATVERDRRRGRLEVVLAIILSIATLASTWCGYQANLWGGVQSSSRTEADTAERQAAEDTIVGLQTRTFDALEVNAYWMALKQKDTATCETIIRRMRPQLQKAIEASLAAGVLHRPDVAGPLQRPEYILSEEESAKRLRKEAGKLHEAAHRAGTMSGSYVALTLMFASVLFFGGITGTFTAPRVRMGLAWVALSLFLFTISRLVGLPACTG